MKGLLRSKRFRNNLYKWITMYVGVMLVFTSVVTYSKYMSSFPYEDNSRIAKFEVEIDTIDEKMCKTDGETNEKICDMGSISPLGELNYYFKVDTSELEVDTMLVLNIEVDKDFEAKNILETDNINNLLTATKASDKIKETCVGTACNQIKRTIKAGSKKITYYKLSLKYKGELSNPEAASTKEYKDIVKIGYSATQLK